jgi:hypothetical protein
MEQVSRPFGIGSRNDGRVNVIETTFLEIGMYGISHLGSDAIHSPERVRAGPKMSDLSQEFHRVAFLLQ